MNNLKTIFLKIVYIVLWISVWNIFDTLINQYVNDNQRILVYFGFALISIYLLQINNILIK